MQHLAPTASVVGSVVLTSASFVCGSDQTCNNNNNEDDFLSAHLPHKVGEHRALYSNTSNIHAHSHVRQGDRHSCKKKEV